MATVTQKPNRLRRLNWWKIGFFIALFAFEVAREWAVLASNERPKLAALATVTNGYGLVTAEGRWARVDGGEKLVPSITRIECWRDRGECTEASIQVNDNYVSAPEIDTFPAQFSADSVAYENNQPICVHYAVRIDLKLEKAFSVRTRTADNAPPCRGMEPRMEMQLGSGLDSSEVPMKGHFLPLLSIVVGVVNLF